MVFPFVKYRLHFNLLCITSSKKKKPIIHEKWDFFSPPSIILIDMKVFHSFFTFWFTPRCQKDQNSAITEYPHSGYISRTKFSNLIKYLVTGAKLIRSPVSSPPNISSNFQFSVLELFVFKILSGLSKQTEFILKNCSQVCFVGKVLA